MIIGAGAVVSGNIENNVVVAGNPGKVIMTLDNFKNRRTENLVDEAKRNAIYIYQKYNRKPNLKEMSNFSILFLPRTENNLKTHILNHSYVGDDKMEWHNHFLDTEPLYSDFDEFIEVMLKDVV